ncbi:hypothetical protein EV421DRAFT_1733127 [Armillaria borealis]|uniref:Uncharacterized protein n=1 Tax=Armillaria borealis TaxID=47425 RepID=A0AA39JV07_9AGAR|nr:hypothetical protein EV421DRAFT_1733127 [Armillaria borealis]
MTPVPSTPPNPSIIVTFPSSSPDYYNNIMATENTKDCVVHTQPKSVSIIHDSGEPLKAMNIAIWEYSAQNFADLNANKLTEKTIIPMLTMGIQDDIVQDWFAVNHEDLIKLNISGFAVEICHTFLDKNWACDLHSQLLASHQPSNENVSTWTSCIFRDLKCWVPLMVKLEAWVNMCF